MRLTAQQDAEQARANAQEQKENAEMFQDEYRRTVKESAFEIGKLRESAQQKSARCQRCSC